MFVAIRFARKAKTTMRIGIIGAGRIGSNLAYLWVKAGHEVQIANSRGPATLTDVAGDTGAMPVEVTRAGHGADAVVVTIPLRFVPDLPDGVLDRRKPGAPVIDTTNYYPWARDNRIADGEIAEIESGMPESVWVSTILGVRVVKAFNGVLWTRLREWARPAGDPDRRALPIAGDEDAGKAVVMRLMDDAGFDPVDAGPLTDSWRQHPSTPVYGVDGSAADVRRLLAAASNERPDDWRAAGEPERAAGA